MQTTNTNTETSAVKATRIYDKKYEKKRREILESGCAYVLKDIIRSLEHCDPVDALNFLKCATDLYEQKFEDIKNGSYYY